MSITLSRGGNSITLTSELQVKRRAGRSNSSTRPTTKTLPNYIDKKRASVDVWQISGVFASGTPEEDARTLVEDIIRDPLGRSSLTLNFDNSLYGLSSYSVAPLGSQAGRISYSAGEKGMVRVDTLELRVVNNS